MAEQGRYDRDQSRGGAYDDDRSSGRGYNPGRDEGRGREEGIGREGGRSQRSDSLFGGGWAEREERGWGSSGGGDTSRDSSMRGRSDDGRYDRDRGGSSSWSQHRDRDERPSGGGLSSWFGGSGSSSRNRDERPDRERVWVPVDADRGSAEGGRLERERLERERLEREGRDRSERGRTERGLRDGDDHRGAMRDRDRDHHRDRDREHRGDDDRRSVGARGSGYGADDDRDGLAVDETGRLIASNKVEGTAVYGLDGERLGNIYNFMVEKRAGKVEYAVMTYGGFLGMGTRYYPLPWQLLKYDTRRGGYRVDLTTRDLERAPSFDRSNEPNFDRGYGERVHNWYGLNY